MATTYTVRITSGNAAFGDNDYDELLEVAGILRRLAVRLENNDVTYGLSDRNGNQVGRFTIDPATEEETE